MNFDNINSHPQQQHNYVIVSEENKEEEKKFVENSEINNCKETENTETEECCALIPAINGGVEEKNDEEGNQLEQQIENSIQRPISVNVNQLDFGVSDIIRKDAIFFSFDEFEKAFKEWQVLSQEKFRVASSEKQGDEDSEVFKRFRYRYVVYHCTHYGRPRKRGAGRRPHQNYLPCGCEAKLRLNYHAQNGGYLLITTLVSKHRHLQCDEKGEFNFDSDGEDEGNKKIKSSPEDVGSCEHSPNSTESFKTPVVISAFSPLSLQPLHNSPSSGGQSSSEGAAELIQQQQKLQKRPSASPRERKSSTYRNNKTINGQQQQHKTTTFSNACDSSLVKNEGELNTAFALNLALKAHHQQQQTIFPTESPQNILSTSFQNFPTTSNRQTSFSDFIRFRPPLQSQFNNSNQNNNLLPLIQELINRSNGNIDKQGNSVVNQSEQQQLLLGLLSQQQQHQQTSQTSISTPTIRQQQVGNSASLLSALQHSFLQQHRPQQQHSSSFNNQITPSTSSNNNSANMLALLQIQNLLQNSPNIFGLKTQQQQQTTPNLINLLSGNNNNKIMAASASNNMKNDTTEARRADIIQEADQILQTIVQQMIRTRDLASYLRRLRQFLSDNFVE
uniref:ZSWIM3 N-terminal domain-containing protein n=1 Tax=Meloidogyne incognita TaxID=6306 RepID=A0A914L842_MELIC